MNAFYGCGLERSVSNVRAQHECTTHHDHSVFDSPCDVQATRTCTTVATNHLGMLGSSVALHNR